MRALLEILGNPHRSGPKFLHVAGTNGKGSTTAMIESVLRAEGYQVGGYYSPYVYDIRERITHGCQMISEAKFAAAATEVRAAAELLESTPMGGPTQFEFKTAMGFWAWAGRDTQFVALEVGLGGRLDATNVVAPIVSVITEIGLDHQQHLGDTISLIAAEKAGIIKQGIPVVTSATSSDALNVISRIADASGSMLWRVGSEVRVKCDQSGWHISTPAREISRVNLKLQGLYQGANSAAAVGAIDAAGITVSDDAIRTGLEEAFLPGRLEVMRQEPKVVLDGAHNPQAAKATVAELPAYRLVYSAAAGHSPVATLKVLAGNAAAVYLCEMASARGLKRDQLEGIAQQIGIEWTWHDTPKEAIGAALADSSPADTILVSGSFYLLGEVREALVAR